MSTQTDRRLPLNRDRVLRAAMDLVDEGGIESLSMRKLGQTLGVEAMSLYNHVANKDEILDAIVDLVYEEIELPSSDEDWEPAIRKFAVSAHDALLRHPWAANLIMTRPRIRPARMQYMESLLGRLRDAGFTGDATYLAYHAVDSHILGFTLWQMGHRIDPERAKELTRTLSREIPFDEYPHIAEHVEQHLSEGSHKEESTFDFLLRLILDGLKRMKGAPGT